MGDDFGAHRILKVVPKSIIFEENQKKRKEVQETYGTKTKFPIGFGFQNERASQEKVSVWQWACCKVAMFRVSSNIKKIDAEMDTRSNQNRSPEIRFFRFGTDLGGSEI